MEVKSDAYILDATASNRSFWRIKEDKRILWIDVEPELEIPPDLLIDCINTGFPDQSFHTIIFDPPHWWGGKKGEEIYTCPNKKYGNKLNEKYGGKEIYKSSSYYGTDKYKTKGALIRFLHNSQNEFNRILWDNGMLWLNWSDVKIPLIKILPIFNNWMEMLRLPIGSAHQTMGDAQNWWVMLMKKDSSLWQSSLTRIRFTNEPKDTG